MKEALLMTNQKVEEMIELHIKNFIKIIPMSVSFSNLSCNKIFNSLAVSIYDAKKILKISSEFK